MKFRFENYLKNCRMIEYFFEMRKRMYADVTK